MDAALDNAYALAALAYNSYGDVDRARIYASLALGHGISAWGPHWANLKLNQDLEKDPKNHWSYRTRMPDYDG